MLAIVYWRIHTNSKRSFCYSIQIGWSVRKIELWWHISKFNAKGHIVQPTPVTGLIIYVNFLVLSLSQPCKVLKSLLLVHFLPLQKYLNQLTYKENRLILFHTSGGSSTRSGSPIVWAFDKCSISCWKHMTKQTTQKVTKQRGRWCWDPTMCLNSPSSVT